MKKEEVGIVLETIGNVAKVKTSRHGDCKNCGACPGDQATVILVQNSKEAKPGQRVVVEIKEINMIKAAFVVYILPLVAAFTGALLGGLIANKLGLNIKYSQMTGMAILFLASLLYIKFFDKSNGISKMQPVIIKILN